MNPNYLFYHSTQKYPLSRYVSWVLISPLLRLFDSTDPQNLEIDSPTWRCLMWPRKYGTWRKPQICDWSPCEPYIYCFYVSPLVPNPFHHVLSWTVLMTENHKNLNFIYATYIMNSKVRMFVFCCAIMPKQLYNFF